MKKINKVKLTLILGFIMSVFIFCIFRNSNAGSIDPNQPATKFLQQQILAAIAQNPLNQTPTFTPTGTLTPGPTPTPATVNVNNFPATPVPGVSTAANQQIMATPIFNSSNNSTTSLALQQVQATAAPSQITNTTNSVLSGSVAATPSPIAGVISDGGTGREASVVTSATQGSVVTIGGFLAGLSGLCVGTNTNTMTIARSSGENSDGTSVQATGYLQTISASSLFNSSTMDRARSVQGASNTTPGLGIASFGFPNYTNLGGNPQTFTSATTGTPVTFGGNSLANYNLWVDTTGAVTQYAAQLLGSSDGGNTYPSTICSLSAATTNASVIATTGCGYTNIKLNISSLLGTGATTLTAGFNGR